MPRPTLIVLGTGFAAFSLIKAIDTTQYDVVVVSPRNHFLFTPLLPSTTVGTLEFRSIIEPIRAARPEVQFYQSLCTAVVPEEKKIQCEGAIDKRTFELRYDILVIAVGAAVNTYGISGVREYALFLKELSDARAIRQKIIECFEQASQPSVSDGERKRLLHFVVVGGGPTGVEFAAEMNDFLQGDLRRSYPMLFNDVRITVLEAGEHILNTFDAALSDYTTRMFQRQHIEVRTGSFVQRVDKEVILLGDASQIPYGLMVWSTGIGAREFIKALSFEKDGASRILTDDFFLVKSTQNVFALGDCAVVEEKNFPATAQVAQQEGKYLARSLGKKARGKRVRPFRYKHYGMLAYVGSNRALADLSTVKGKGFSAWLFWRSAYLTKLVSFKNKVLVIFDWFKTFVFGRDISRFLTHEHRILNIEH